MAKVGQMKSVRKFGAAMLAALLLASTMQANVAQAGVKISPNVVSLGLNFKENSELGKSANSLEQRNRLLLLA